MKKTKILVFIIIVAMLTAMLAACKSEDDPGGENPGGNNPGGQTPAYLTYFESAPEIKFNRYNEDGWYEENCYELVIKNKTKNYIKAAFSIREIKNFGKNNENVLEAKWYEWVKIEEMFAPEGEKIVYIFETYQTNNGYGFNGPEGGSFDVSYEEDFYEYKISDIVVYPVISASNSAANTELARGVRVEEIILPKWNAAESRAEGTLLLINETFASFTVNCKAAILVYDKLSNSEILAFKEIKIFSVDPVALKSSGEEDSSREINWWYSLPDGTYVDYRFTVIVYDIEVFAVFS